METEKFIYLNNLFSLYHSLLSETQKEILQDYYEYNLSLSEISENRNISRSAVDDALKKGTKKLNELEDKLHLYQLIKDLKDIDDQKINEILNKYLGGLD